MSDDLKATRPSLRQADILCVKCGKQPDLWAHYGLRESGQVAAHGGAEAADGIIHGFVECHGAHLEIAISYRNIEAMHARGEKLRVFDEVPALEMALPIEEPDL